MTLLHYYNTVHKQPIALKSQDVENKFIWNLVRDPQWPH
jgi:hypothetical protein